MGQFLGTHLNRLDAKGRVSVPSPFRAALRARAEAAGETDGGASMILRSSHLHPCIEAWPPAAFQGLATPLDRLDMFSQAHDDLAQVLYADAFPVEADKEGRIVLPERLAAHAGLTGQIVFMGMGKTFQIWEPAAAERRQLDARERARAREMTLPGAPPGSVAALSVAPRSIPA